MAPHHDALLSTTLRPPGQIQWLQPRGSTYTRDKSLGSAQRCRRLACPRRSQITSGERNKSDCADHHTCPVVVEVAPGEGDADSAGAVVVGGPCWSVSGANPQPEGAFTLSDRRNGPGMPGGALLHTPSIALQLMPWMYTE